MVDNGMKSLGKNDKGLQNGTNSCVPLEKTLYIQIQ